MVSFIVRHVGTWRTPTCFSTSDDVGKRAYLRNVCRNAESNKQRESLNATYPLVFSFRDAVSGNGFVAYVAVSGRVLLTNEGDGDIWMFGVQPGGIAGGGHERSEAFREFKKSYLSVFFDIAAEATSFEDFEESVKLFFSEVNEPNLGVWDEAVAAVRAGRLSLSDLKSRDADSCPPKIDVKRIDNQATASDNSFDEIREAA
jgi:hypothetical protein